AAAGVVALAVAARHVSGTQHGRMRVEVAGAVSHAACGDGGDRRDRPPGSSPPASCRSRLDSLSLVLRFVVIAALVAVAAPDVASAHPQPVPPGELASHWSAPPAVLAAAVLALVLFARAFVRLRRRGRPDLAPWSGCALFASGLALVIGPLVSPLDGVADRYLPSAHMLQHVLIADAGAALLVLAVRGPLALFLLPRAVLRRLAAARSAFGLLVRPNVAFALWVAAFGGWHFPSAYDYSLLHPWAHELEHATFALHGTLAMIMIVDPLRHGRLTRGGRALFAFGMFAFAHAIASGLLLSRAPAYAVYADQPHRLFG